MTTENELHGYDGRVIYVDGVTLRLIREVLPEHRGEVRRMMREDWMGTMDLQPAQLLTPAGIDSAQITVSDCVARCRIVFNGGMAVFDSNGLHLHYELPDTLRMGLRGRRMRDIIDHPVLDGEKDLFILLDGPPLTVRGRSDAIRMPADI